MCRPEKLGTTFVEPDVPDEDVTVYESDEDDDWAEEAYESDEERFALELRSKALTLHLLISCASFIVEYWTTYFARDLVDLGPGALATLLFLALTPVHFALSVRVIKDGRFRARFMKHGHKVFATGISMVHTARFLKLALLPEDAVAAEAAGLAAALAKRKYWTVMSLAEATRTGAEDFGLEATFQAWVAFSWPLISREPAFQASLHVWNLMSTAVVARLCGGYSLAVVAPAAICVACSVAGNAVVRCYLAPLWLRAQAPLRARVAQVEAEKERLAWDYELAASSNGSPPSEPRSLRLSSLSSGSARRRFLARLWPCSSQAESSTISVTTSCVRSLIDDPVATYDARGVVAPSPAAALLGDHTGKLWRRHATNQVGRIRRVVADGQRPDDAPERS